MNENLNYIKTIKFLSQYIIKYKKNFVIFYIGCLVEMFISFINPILFGIMVNEIVYYNNIPTFIKISLIFVSILFFSCILSFFIYAQHHYLMNKYTFDIKRDVFKQIQNLDAITLNNMTSGDSITNIQNYSTECMNFVIRNIIHTLNHIIMVLIIINYLFIINWQTGLIILLTLPLAIYINARFGNKTRKIGNEQRIYYSKYIGWLYEILTGSKDIRILGAVSRPLKKFINHHKNIFDLNNKLSIYNLSAKNLIVFINLFMQLSFFIFTGYLAMNSNITIGSFVIVIYFFNIIKDKIQILSESYVNAQNRISFIQRIFNIMKTTNEDIKWKGNKELIVTKGEIMFHDVSFSYDNTIYYAINNISFNIKSLEHLALVGKSGSGKSTIVNILMGFYKPQNGYIEIDGQKLNECSLKSIRANISIVQQESFLFDGSIKDNIMIGNRNKTLNDIMIACEQVDILQFILSLPNGFDTVIGKNGIDISKGQKQRIAIARVLLKNTKIIIFDEATSNLDKESESDIYLLLSIIAKDKTVIIITHNYNSIKFCRKVILLDKGLINKIGTPEQLIEDSIAFNELFLLNNCDGK